MTYKHNFVIFGAAEPFFEIAYADAVQLPNVRYYREPVRSKRASGLLNRLYRLHLSAKLNDLAGLPFKQIWLGRHFENDFEQHRPLCFVFFSNWVKTMSYGFPEYLRKHYPGAKLVCYFQDLIAKKKYTDIEQVKKTFDLVMSFDPKEAGEYGISYHPLVYSADPETDVSQPPESDVFFLGLAKNRLPTILKAYETLREGGLSCRFFLAGVKKADQLYKEDIRYITHMSYQDNLREVKGTRCMLEVMQTGGHGYTLRMMEAVAYNKKMITNNPEIHKAPFFSAELIQQFNAPDKIDPAFVHTETALKAYPNKEVISPVELLRFIDAKV